MNAPRQIPQDDAQRAALHNEVLRRPPPRMGLPVHALCVVVANADVDLATECAHLAKLPGQRDLDVTQLGSGHLRVQVGACTLRWERHTDFTRYTLMRALPPATLINDVPQQYVSQLFPEDGWLEQVPGQTLAATHLVMLWGEPPHAVTRATAYGHWFAEGAAVASLMGTPPHSCVVTDLALQPDGFARMLVVAAQGMGEPRAGRIAQRLLDIETYRIMALRGLPAAQTLMAPLRDMEDALVALIANSEAPPETLLAQLLPLAASLEASLAAHRPLFDASRAYAAITAQRLSELREKQATDTRTLSEQIERRLAPALATMAATERRLEDLSARVARATGLLNTRLTATMEQQNRHTIATQEQTRALVRRLQVTVAGLTIGVGTFCISSLIWQLARVVQRAGVDIEPLFWATGAVPFVLGAVWWGVAKLNRPLPPG